MLEQAKKLLEAKLAQYRARREEALAALQKAQNVVSQMTGAIGATEDVMRDLDARAKALDRLAPANGALPPAEAPAG